MTDAEKKEFEALKAKTDRTKEEQAKLDALTAKADADDGEKTYGEPYVKSLRQEAAKYRTKTREMEERLAKFDGIDPEQIQALLKKAEEDEKKGLEEKGDFAKLREQLIEAHKTELSKKDAAAAELTAKIASLEGELNRTILGYEVATAAAVAKAINPRLVEMVALNNMKVETTDDGRRVVRVLDKDGQPRVDLKTGAPLSTSQFIEEMKQIEEYAHLFAGAKAGAGSTSTHNFQGNRIVNPWKKESHNLTVQAQILRSDPNLAARLKEEAGVK